MRMLRTPIVTLPEAACVSGYMCACMHVWAFAFSVYMQESHLHSQETEIPGHILTLKQTE